MVKKEPAKIGPSDGGAEENSGGLKGCARKFAELPDCVMKLICMVTLLLSDAMCCARVSIRVEAVCDERVVLGGARVYMRSGVCRPVRGEESASTNGKCPPRRRVT
jgi:hypothetical protein